MQEHGNKYFSRRPPTPIPRDPMGMGSKDQNSTFTDHDHVLNQIEKNRAV